MRFSCGGCNKRWDGYNTCHCAGCHTTFSGITAFDLHQVKGECLHPSQVLTKDGGPRLVLVDRRYECWGWPSKDDNPFVGTTTLEGVI